jgi:hypothetical protein
LNSHAAVPWLAQSHQLGLVTNFPSLAKLRFWFWMPQPILYKMVNKGAVSHPFTDEIRG